MRLSPISRTLRAFATMTSCPNSNQRLGTKQAEMKIVGCDLHAKRQTIAMVDNGNGRVHRVETAPRSESGRRVLRCAGRSSGGGHRSNRTMQWFLDQLEELGVECRLGHPVKIRVAGQKNSWSGFRPAEEALRARRQVLVPSSEADYCRFARHPTRSTQSSSISDKKRKGF